MRRKELSLEEGELALSMATAAKAEVAAAKGQRNARMDINGCKWEQQAFGYLRSIRASTSSSHRLLPLHSAFCRLAFSQRTRNEERRARRNRRFRRFRRSSRGCGGGAVSSSSGSSRENSFSPFFSRLPTVGSPECSSKLHYGNFSIPFYHTRISLQPSPD